MLRSTPAAKAFTANPSFLLRLDLDPNVGSNGIKTGPHEMPSI